MAGIRILLHRMVKTGSWFVCKAADMAETGGQYIAICGAAFEAEKGVGSEEE